MRVNIREKVLSKYDSRCAYCGCHLTLKTMQIDHIVPVSQNGSNEFENLNPSCRMCNFYKGGSTIDVFRERMKTLLNRLDKVYIFRLASKYNLISATSFDSFYFENREVGNE